MIQRICRGEYTHFQLQLLPIHIHTHKYQHTNILQQLVNPLGAEFTSITSHHITSHHITSHHITLQWMIVACWSLPRTVTKLGVDRALKLPFAYSLKAGIGILRSWLMISDTMKVSPESTQQWQSISEWPDVIWYTHAGLSHAHHTTPHHTTSRHSLPIAADFLLNPPAVPALIIKSGLTCLMAIYVFRAAGTVPTSSTPYRGHFPLVIFKSTATATATATEDETTWDQG